MKSLDELLDEYGKKVTILEIPLFEKFGMWGNYYFSPKTLKPYIFLEVNQPEIDKRAILVEEFKHYLTSVGIIVNQTSHEHCKQEALARHLAYKDLISIDDLIYCYNQGLQSNWEIAEALEVEPEFLHNALTYFKTVLDNNAIYHSKYGDFRIIVSSTLNFYRMPESADK